MVLHQYLFYDQERSLEDKEVCAGSIDGAWKIQPYVHVYGDYADASVLPVLVARVPKTWEERPADERDERLPVGQS